MVVPELNCCALDSFRLFTVSSPQIKEDPLKSVLPHFRCRLGASTRRKSLYPSSLGTVYRPFGRSRFPAQQVRGLMDATPRMPNGLALRNGSRLHRKCGRTDLSAVNQLIYEVFRFKCSATPAQAGHPHRNHGGRAGGFFMTTGV